MADGVPYQSLLTDEDFGAAPPKRPKAVKVSKKQSRDAPSKDFDVMDTTENPVGTETFDLETGARKAVTRT